MIYYAIFALISLANAATPPVQVFQMGATPPNRKQIIADTFNHLNKDSLPLIDAFYDTQVVFEDPIVHLEGIEAVKKYYEKLYENVTQIHFDISEQIVEGNTHALVWRMFLTAKGLNRGQEIIVPGTSIIKFGGNEQKVIYHRDYFDMGSFLYEHIPILKQLIQLVKNRLK